jgi:hypothetical protein
MIGSIGSIASAWGKENTSFATGWPMRRPIAKNEKDWNIVFARCVTNVSGAGIGDRAGSNVRTTVTSDALVLGNGERIERALPEIKP